MGLLKDSLKVVNYIVTLGGSEELACAQRLYERTYSIYKKDFDKLKKIEEGINTNLSALGSELVKLRQALKKRISY